MALTEEQINEYIENNGLICPYCYSSDILAGDFDDITEENLTVRDVECVDCEREWIETYSLIAICETDESIHQTEEVDDPIPEKIEITEPTTEDEESNVTAIYC